MQNYVATLLSKPHRSTFAQFCCVFLPLIIEKGRYRELEMIQRDRHAL